MGTGFRIGAGIGIAAGLYQSWKNYQAGGVNMVVHGLTGWNPADGNFNLRKANAMIPMAAGIGVSFIAAKVGVNRYTPKGINL